MVSHDDAGQLVTCPRCGQQIPVPIGEVLSTTYSMNLVTEQVTMVEGPPALGQHLDTCPGPDTPR